jgi:hypothetical protein
MLILWYIQSKALKLPILAKACLEVLVVGLLRSSRVVVHRLEERFSVVGL